MLLASTKSRGLTSKRAFGERISKPKPRLGDLTAVNPNLAPSLQQELKEYFDDILEEQENQRSALEDVAKAERLLEVRFSINTQLTKDRCKKELAKKNPTWVPIDMNTVLQNHEKVAKGMLYGLEFPWNEETLEKFGPEWLTKAMHIAGTLAKDNKVIEIHLNNKTKITAGNNGGKFLFQVKYARADPELHTKLFAKCPFKMTPATKSDRISSSVYKQPMDFGEVNTYRLYSSAFPFQTPKFYYGDISNETSNFILILECLDYAKFSGKGGPTKPNQIEGPYDKCKDFLLPGPAKEYYTKLIECLGMVAAAHKRGKFGSDATLLHNLLPYAFGTGKMEDYGCTPLEASGWKDLGNTRNIVAAGYRFVGNIAKILFPSYVTQPSFEKKFTEVLMTINAYNREIDFYKNDENDYVALGHQNLNMDNGYFWRDESGALQCGALDWGGFGILCIAHKVWWCLNSAEFDNIYSNLDYYIEVCLTCYERDGGVRLDRNKFTNQIKLTALQNLLWTVNAVPNTLKQCSAKEWLTIKDRHDPRIASDVDGKTTLRTSIFTTLNGTRLLEELKGDKVLADWIEKFYHRECGITPKTREMIGLD